MRRTLVIAPPILLIVAAVLGPLLDWWAWPWSLLAILAVLPAILAVPLVGWLPLPRRTAYQVSVEASADQRKRRLFPPRTRPARTDIDRDSEPFDEVDLAPLARRHLAQSRDVLTSSEGRLELPVAEEMQLRLEEVYSGADRSGWFPPRGRTGPLPHDGLLLRRNNAFGTRLAHGVADLIEEGVLIDQEAIRFDDFVAGNVHDLPAPADGSAVAIRHGSTAADDCKAREQTTHFVEIALRAADAHGGTGLASPPVPVNIVFVVDTSGSMEGEKIDLVKTAIIGLFRQLRDDDILGIVSFDTRTRTVLRSQRKAEIDEDQLVDRVGALSPGGGTDINMGVLYGLDELARHGGGGTVASYMYLFSDGAPTSGETDWIKIRANIATRTRGEVTLSCFGFGRDARMRELDALAGITGGQSTFVIHPETVGLALAEDQTRREHLAAINIQIKIEIPAEVTVWHLYGHDLITDPAARHAVEQDASDAGRRGFEQLGVAPLPDLITDETGLRVFAPDLAFGEAYWIVLEVQVPDGDPEPDLGAVTVQFLDVSTRRNVREHLRLGDHATIPAAVVQAHAVGLWTSEVTFHALDDLYANDRATAKQRLTNHAEKLLSAFSRTTVPQFRDDRVIIMKLASLTENLGQVRRFHDSSAGAWEQTVHTMSHFGMVRGGYQRMFHT